MLPDPAPPQISLLDGFFYAEDPHPAFRWMRDHAPVYRDEAGSCWGIARHADIMWISKRPSLFSSAAGSRPDSPPIPSMINLDDPAHKRRRNLVNRGFTPRQVQQLEPLIRRVCRERIGQALERGRFDFVREVAAPLPMIVIGEMLGVAPEDRELLLRWSDEMILGTSSSATPERAEAAARAFREYAAYHARVVEGRRRRPGEDLISVLVHAEIDGERLSDEELLQESLLILVGGDETTRHVISGGLEALLRHPDQKRRLLREPAGLPVAIEEMLRWVTPIQNMARHLTRDVELRGTKLSEGDTLLLLYPSADRDERVFERPEVFEIGRSPNPHVAFGGYGTHFCLGASLARLELRVVFEELLPALPALELASDEPPPRRPSNFIVGLEALPVVYRP
ncbi:MAG: cytochrome P450 [Myxococcota bacterium]